MKIPLARPDITEREIEEVVKVMKSNILSNGKRLERFEEGICDYIGVKNAVAVNSGTSALHLLVRALGIKEGDEVITTPFSFIASSNCILFEKAKPVFVDIEEKTYGMDLEKLEEKITEKTKAILTVDVFGQPFNIEKTLEIAKKYDLEVIDDACEAIGAEWKGEKVGSFTHSTFAFYPNKQMTTGEGGAIVTGDDQIAELCRSMRSQGRAKTGTWLHHERLGYNYRMSEIHAAIGLVQLSRLDKILERRDEIAQKYNECLKKIEGVKIPFIDQKVTKTSWFVYVIRLDKGIDRDGVLQHLVDEGIQCKPYFTPIHLQPFYVDMFGYQKGDYPVCEAVGDSVIALPFFNKITDEEIEMVCKTMEEAIEDNFAGITSLRRAKEN